MLMGKFTLEVKCESGHHQNLTFEGEEVTREWLIEYGKIMDGTSPIYKYPPREYPMDFSMCGKCAWPIPRTAEEALKSRDQQMLVPCCAWINCRVLDEVD